MWQLPEGKDGFARIITVTFLQIVLVIFLQNHCDMATSRKFFLSRHPESRYRSSPVEAGVLALLLVLLSALAAPVQASSLEEVSRLQQAGQHAEALRQVDRHLAINPQDAHGRFLRGIILANMNRNREAIAVFERLTQDFPHLPEPHNNLAVLYAQQQQFEKAKIHLEKAIRTHPAYATAHENLGDIYARLASQAYQRALQVDSANVSTRTKLAMIDSIVPGGERPASAPVAAMAIAAAPTRPSPPPPPPVAITTPVAPPAPVVVATAPPARATEPPPAPPPAAPAARPAPAAVPAAPATEAPRQVAVSDAQVIAAVDDWLAAWSRQDARAYLGFYARNFRVPGGLTRRAWETERTQRVTRPASIRVTRANLSVRMEGENRASVRFRQTYRAPGFNATTMKTLEMVREGNRWLILEERTG